MTAEPGGKPRQRVVAVVVIVAAAACVLGIVVSIAQRRPTTASAPVVLASARGAAYATDATDATDATHADAGADMVLVVPRAKAAPVLDGELTDAVWMESAVRTGPFLESGGPSLARPYSEARFSWGDGQLYVGLYASDEDIRATHDAADGQVWRDDSFRLAFRDDTADAREYLFDVSALGVLADGVRAASSPPAAVDYTWSSHARIGHELEGTPNDASNNDEEWVIELAIPLASLGKKGVRGERLGLWASRCDTPKGQSRSCGDWGRTHGRGVLVLD